MSIGLLLILSSDQFSRFHFPRYMFFLKMRSLYWFTSEKHKEQMDVHVSIRYLERYIVKLAHL